jgi:hypothetical protein
MIRRPIWPAGLFASLLPGVHTAGMHIMEARALLVSAGSALYPLLQETSGAVSRRFMPAISPALPCTTLSRFS